MPDTQQTHAEWQTEQHHAAQESAVAWALKAEAAADDALRSDAYVTEHGASDYMRSRVAEERVNVQEHQARSTTARQLAEMWARVATALTASAPVDGPHATYDVYLSVKTLREAAAAAEDLAGPSDNTA
ncbi:hypothetical protein [Streptomyces sp. NBC_00035]|uniref:hypothetical protein n=1 Tax=Streptomyces sp. NBC_00035 TaxID=2903614 RepID=UPI0032474929